MSLFFLLFFTLTCVSMEPSGKWILKKEGSLVTSMPLMLFSEKENKVHNVLVTPQDLDEHHALHTAYQFAQKYKNKKIDFSQSEYLSYETWRDCVEPLTKCLNAPDTFQKILQEYNQEELMQLFILTDYLQSQRLPQKVVKGLMEKLKDPAWLTSFFQAKETGEQYTLVHTLNNILKENPKLWSKLNKLILFKSHTKQKVLVGHKGVVRYLAYSPDSNQLASGSNDKTIILWDPKTGQKQRVLEGHKDWVSYLAYRPDGNQLASGSGDETRILWDPKTGQKQHVLKGQGVVSYLAYRPDGNQLTSVFLEEHKDWVCRLVYRPDGNQVSGSSGDKTIILYNMVIPSKFESANLEQLLLVRYVLGDNQIVPESCADSVFQTLSAEQKELLENFMQKNV